MKQQTKQKDNDALSAKGLQRRKFLTMIGGTASVITIAAACNDDDNVPPGGNTVDLGSGDTGILNYAYALEQLEAAFYAKVVTDSASVFSSEDLALMTDIRDHEIAHREFFKAALAGNAIVPLTPDFSSIDFTSKEKVLLAAKAFEDLGVTAYNGAGHLLTNPDFLLLAGKIVSVEARHAAFIRDMLSYGSFADNTVVDTTSGLEVDTQGADTPVKVVAIANTYLKTKVSANNLPTN